VIEQHGAHTQSPPRRAESLPAPDEVERFTLEARAAAEPGAVQGLICVQLGGNEREINRVVVHQIPGVGGELVFDLVNETGWPVERQFALASEAETQ